MLAHICRRYADCHFVGGRTRHKCTTFPWFEHGLFLLRPCMRRKCRFKALCSLVVTMYALVIVPPYPSLSEARVTRHERLRILVNKHVVLSWFLVCHQKASLAGYQGRTFTLCDSLQCRWGCCRILSIYVHSRWLGSCHTTEKREQLGASAYTSLRDVGRRPQ